MSAAAAHWYANQGWPVFPCWEKGKEPLTMHGFKDASTDHGVIDKWWTQYPRANLALVSGKPSGWFALDVDGSEGAASLAELERVHGALPDTVEQTTGRGRHLLFALPTDAEIKNSAGRLGPGLDIRADGGYIIVAPSVHPSGTPYRWKDGHKPSDRLPAAPPAWLIRLLQEKPSTSSTNNVSNSSTNNASNNERSPYVQAALAGELGTLLAAREGQRNDALNRAAFNIGTLVGAGALELTHVRERLIAAALSIGLGRPETERTVDSGLEHGIANPREIPPPERRGRAKTSAQRAKIEISTRASEEWPEPDMSVLNPRRPAPELPAEAFGPYWCKWLDRQAEIVSAPSAYIGLGLLVAASALIGNARWVSPWAGWREPPVLWGCLVGSPSSSKSPALDVLRSHFAGFEAEDAPSFELAIREWEGAKERAKIRRELWEDSVRKAAESGHPAPPLPTDAVVPERPTRARLWSSDTTPEALAAILAATPKGLLAHRDELAGWLGSFDRYSGGSGDRAFWLEGFGGRPYTKDRVKSPEPISIKHLSISVLGGLQPDVLADAVLAGADDGLSARLLYVWPEPVPPRRPSASSMDDGAAEALRRLHALKLVPDEKGVLSPLVVKLSEAAAGDFDVWRLQHVANEPPGPLGGWWGKQPGIVLRLALILEFLWWCATPGTPEPTEISDGALGGAAVLCDEFFKPMAARAFGDAALPEVERDAAHLAKWVDSAKPKKINARQIRRDGRVPGTNEASRIHAAVEFLVESGWLRPAPTRKSENKGRLRADYDVNPALLVVQ